ncbi:universal stress protein [Paracoccus alkanivorans]|uniref:Universal stress protein n=1 Tax=Paracoccus alkanivorans TaxID=2116655 RepID=A0A3M0M8X3_9RHOB|nr:universal stress protein [Paracoccus alkanivorans]RMC33693.1 universal stress protein [Paracoccus alkanivorans]
MPENVLLPIDLQQSESWKMTLTAARRQVDDGGTIHLLGIVPDIGSSMVATYLPKDYEVHALQAMKDGLDRFADEHFPEGAKVRTHVGHGHVAETILKIAKKTNADIIVMASPQRDELRSILISSHTNAVVRHSPCSVLVVR